MFAAIVGVRCVRERTRMRSIKSRGAREWPKTRRDATRRDETRMDVTRLDKTLAAPPPPPRHQTADWMCARCALCERPLLARAPNTVNSLAPPSQSVRLDCYPVRHSAHSFAAVAHPVELFCVCVRACAVSQPDRHRAAVGSGLAAWRAAFVVLRSLDERSCARASSHRRVSEPSACRCARARACDLLPCFSRLPRLQRAKSIGDDE